MGEPCICPVKAPTLIDINCREHGSKAVIAALQARIEELEGHILEALTYIANAPEPLSWGDVELDPAAQDRWLKEQFVRRSENGSWLLPRLRAALARKMGG